MHCKLPISLKFRFILKLCSGRKSLKFDPEEIADLIIPTVVLPINLGKKLSAKTHRNVELSSLRPAMPSANELCNSLRFGYASLE